jgi:hypothetical protein
MENKGRVLVDKELDGMPDYSNEYTRAAEGDLGEFIFDRIASPRSSPLIDKGPLEMDNGAIYHGQWNTDGQREGKGI